MNFIDFKDLNLEEYVLDEYVGDTVHNAKVYTLKQKNSNSTLIDTTLIVALKTHKDNIERLELSKFHESSLIWVSDHNFYNDKKPGFLRINKLQKQVNDYAEINNQTNAFFSKADHDLNYNYKEYNSVGVMKEMLPAIRKMIDDYFLIYKIDDKKWETYKKLNLEVYKKLSNDIKASTYFTKPSLDLIINELPTDDKKLYNRVTFSLERFCNLLGVKLVFNPNAYLYAERSYSFTFEDGNHLDVLANVLINSQTITKELLKLNYINYYANKRDGLIDFATKLGHTLTLDKLNKLIKEERVSKYFDSLKSLYVAYYYYLCES